MTKQELRKEMRSRQDAYGPSEVSAAAERIWKQIESIDAFAQAECVLAYMAISGEVPTESFIRRWEERKRIAIPLVQGNSLILKEYSTDRISSGYRGIMEPTQDAVEIAPREVNLAIVPGVAFARNKESGRVERLGRGGGFYDRLLSEMNCIKVGICLPYRVVEELPCEPHDITLDLLCDGVV